MLILIGLYVYNLIILLAFISSLFIHDLFLMAILSLTVKSLFEFIFLYTFAKKMDRLFYLKYYPVVALLHIPYVVILGGLGQLVKFKWKGEKHKKLSDK
jgi:hypothetical protein